MVCVYATRFQLNLTDDQIDALPVPFWSKRIFRAMAHYGMIVGDQTSVPWKVEVESGSTYTSLGYADPWVQIAQAWGVPHYYDGDTGRDVYSMDLSGPDWSRHLRVIDPLRLRRLLPGSPLPDRVFDGFSPEIPGKNV